ncbi:MAG: transposase, partial [Planctomycetota bacterium]
MAERHDLRDDEWDRIKHLLPTGGRRGRPWRNHRQVINGVHSATRVEGSE